MKFNISQNAINEFQFYSNSQMDMIGHEIGNEIPNQKDGHTALECWWAKDTHGVTLPCREPELLSKVFRSKKSINLQIKLWAEDIADGVLLRQSELIEYVHGWPEWVIRATIEQAGKLVAKSIGFVPRFARLEYVFGNLWLPEMDRFDASI